MSKKRLKPSVKKFLLFSFSFVLLFVGIISVKNIVNEPINDNFVYVSDSIYQETYPVSKEEEKIIKPYNDKNVMISRYFYDSAEKDSIQEKSLYYYDGVYMPNKGVDYSSTNSFDVLSISAGEVSNIYDDELLGKVVEIKINDNVKILYGSLSDVVVQKGDKITQGQIISISGCNKLNNENKNSLHIELIKNNKNLNVEKYYNKTLEEIMA